MQGLLPACNKKMLGSFLVQNDATISHHKVDTRKEIHQVTYPGPSPSQISMTVSSIAQLVTVGRRLQHSPQPLKAGEGTWTLFCPPSHMALLYTQPSVFSDCPSLPTNTGVTLSLSETQIPAASRGAASWVSNLLSHAHCLF